jgi:hypothetical protein
MWQQVHSYLELIITKAIIEQKEFESEIEIPANLLSLYSSEWAGVTMRLKLDIQFDGELRDDAKPTNPTTSRERH